MKQVLTLLPNPILKDYVIKHFDELTLENFFEIINLVKIPIKLFKNNKILSSNSAVLSRMLDIDIYAFRYFRRASLNKECIDKIAKSNIIISEDDLNRFPELLTNNLIYNKLLRMYPKTVVKLKEELDIDIEKLENSNYIPSIEDINNCRINSSKILLSNGIKSNCTFIIYIKELDIDLVNLAIDNGYIPKKEDFYINPELKEYKELLDKAFLINPSIIIFYNRKDLSEDKVISAIKRGYIINKEDIINNQELAYSSIFMEYAIKYDPKLILLVGDTCNINPLLIEEVLNKCKISEDDLRRNPNITKNNNIMFFLPQFKLYYAYLNKEDKITAIINYLSNNFSKQVLELPFFRDKTIDKKFKFAELFDYLKLDIKEDDIEVQKNYYFILMNLIDSIMYIRYIKSKNTFRYPDIVTIYKDILNILNNPNNINSFIDNIKDFTSNIVSREYILDNLNNFYNIYINTGVLTLNDTSIFCNYILNIHKNIFISNGRKILINNVIYQLRISKRKELNLLNSIKLKKISYLIVNKDFDKLGISEEEFNKLLENTRYDINNNKYIKKYKVFIDSRKWNELISKFLELGYIDSNIVFDILNITDIKIVKYIVNIFLKIKYKLINNIDINDTLFNTNISSLNYNNYLIFDKERYLRNLAKLILDIKDNDIDKILDNKDMLNEVIYLIPLLDLINEFDINSFINILINYKKIKNKISTNKLYDLISLAFLYGTIDNIEVMALGHNISNLLGEENVHEHIKFYLKMLNKTTSSIPPIYISTSKYILESGIYSDPERLLIGHIPNINSCVKLFNSAGGKTYNEALLESTGDVILVKDKNNSLISRILLFRRGNVINMVTNDITTYPYELYKDIANEIIKQSILNKDNIDYVFVNYKSVDNYNNYNIITNNNFIDLFPHADFTPKVILVGSKTKDINLNFKAVFDTKYTKVRKKINYNPNVEDIIRLRALKLIIEEDKSELEPVDLDKYKSIILGEDWYIAIRNDDSIEEVVLPSNDPRTYEEIKYIKENLLLDNNYRIFKI